MDTSKRCCLPQCSGLRFNLVHKFPRKIERAEEWLKAFDCPHLNATPHNRLVLRCVCCRHFRAEDYVHGKARVLNPTAVPSLNLKKLNELNKCRQTRIEKPSVLTPDEIEWLIHNADSQKALNIQIGDVSDRQIETNSVDASEPLIEENTTDFELFLNEDVLKIVDSQLNSSLKVNVLWLRSICRCSICYDDVKGIHNYNLYDIQGDLQPVKAMLTQKSRLLEIIWSDDHTSTYNLNELYEKFQSKPASTSFYKYLLWTSPRVTSNDELQPLQYHDVIRSKNVLYTALDRLQKTGILIIQGISKCDIEYELQKNIISKLFYHNWDSLISEKRTLLSNHQSIPFTNCTFESMDKALQILTVPYYKENMKIPLCLVDGIQAASQISKTSYQCLTQYCMDFGFTSKKGFKYIIKHPVIAIGERIFFAPHNIENIKSEDFKQISLSLKDFNDVLNLKENQWNVELNNENMIIIDNYRICWNINQPQPIENELKCFYIERKHYLSSLNTLKTSR